MKSGIFTTIIGSFFCLFLFVYCSNPQNSKSSEFNNNTDSLLYHNRYASTFKIFSRDKDTYIENIQRWQDGDSSSFTYRLPKSPLKRVVCLSTTHIAYIEALGLTDCIVGVSGAAYVSSAKVVSGLQNGSIIDVGYDSALDYERILNLKPDAVFAYGIQGESLSYTDRLIELGINVIYIGDHFENHPLGKAEYLMEFAWLFGHPQEGQRLIEEIFHSYEDLASFVRSATAEPSYRATKVILNLPYKDVWYVPGKNNYLYRIIADAGGEVLGSAGSITGSRSISSEQAYIFARQADIWLHTNEYTNLSDMISYDLRFASVPSVRTKMVYNNNRRITKGGGSDFWESGVVKPQVILADLIHILHPELLPDYEPVYYQKLSDTR